MIKKIIKTADWVLTHGRLVNIYQSTISQYFRHKDAKTTVTVAPMAAQILKLMKISYCILMKAYESDRGSYKPRTTEPRTSRMLPAYWKPLDVAFKNELASSMKIKIKLKCCVQRTLLETHYNHGLSLVFGAKGYIVIDN